MRLIITGIVMLLFFSSLTVSHQNGCHSRHSCPSDTGSYECGDTGHCTYCPDNDYCFKGNTLAKIVVSKSTNSKTTQASTYPIPSVIESITATPTATSSSPSLSTNIQPKQISIPKLVLTPTPSPTLIQTALPTQKTTATPTVTPIASMVEKLKPLPTLSPVPGQTSQEPKSEKQHVKRIIDGDTIVLADGGKVRLLEIDTPELNPCWQSGRQCKPQKCALEAKNRLQGLLQNNEVTLEKGAEEKDKYGRLLRYIFVDKKLVNLQLVEEGLAKAQIQYPSKKYRTEILTAQEKAIQNKSCLWTN